MWLRSIFLKTLRDYRVAILGWGVGIGVLAPMVFASLSVLGGSPEAQAELTMLVRNPVFRIFGEPVDIEHGGGYATWRLGLVLPTVGVWALLAASRMLRGEEEGGSLDVLLSVPRSRVRVVAEKLAALEAALLLIGLLIAALAFAGGRIARVEVRPLAALLFGCNISLLASVFGALALLLSQFRRERREAAGLTGALLAFSFVLTAAARTVRGLEWTAWISPVHYFELSKPLIPGYGADPAAMLVLASLAAVLSAVAVALFVCRDIGAPVAFWRDADVTAPHPPSPQALLPGSWSLGSVFARSVRALTPSTLWWGIALGTYTALLIALVRRVQQNLLDLMNDLARGNPLYAELIARFLGGNEAATNGAFLSVIFTLLVAAFAAFALTLANRWAADGQEGRLDLLLTTPRSRSHVILARFGAIVVALLAASALLFTGAALSAAAVGMTLSTPRLAQAAFGMVPVGLVVASAGYLLAGWLRTATVTGLLMTALLASFLLNFLGPLFSLPQALLRLSIFEGYGMPLVDGLRVSGMLALLAVATGALAVATIRFARHDLVR